MGFIPAGDIPQAQPSDDKTESGAKSDVNEEVSESVEVSALMLELHVRLLSGEELGAFSVVADASVLDLKRQLLQLPALQDACAHSLRLVFADRALQDGDRFSAAGVPGGARLLALRCPSQRAEAVLRCWPPPEHDTRARALAPLLELDAAHGVARVSDSAAESMGRLREVQLDAVYGEESSQEDLFAGSARSIVEGVVEGRSGLILCYGATGSGKCHTLFGHARWLRSLASLQGDRDPEAEGLLPRSFDCIAECIKRLPPSAAAVVSVSFMEIVSERVYDLLAGGTHGRLPECRVRRKDGTVYAEGLTERRVCDAGAMRASFADGWARHFYWLAHMGGCASSRTHMLFTIKVDVLEVGCDGSRLRRSATLRFVKLGGAESLPRSPALRHQRDLRSTCADFVAVVRTLARNADGCSQPAFVPWRNSQITHLLKDDLDGSAKTLLVATCCARLECADSTFTATLRLAQEMRRVVGSPRVCETTTEGATEEELEALRRDAWAVPPGGGEGPAAAAEAPSQAAAAGG